MRLVIEDEAGTRSIVPFAGEPIVVGRAPEGVTFRLTDRNVSRRHARFVLQNGSVFVEDLGSLVGTRVNGERIDGKPAGTTPVTLRDLRLDSRHRVDLALPGYEIDQFVVLPEKDGQRYVRRLVRGDGKGRRPGAP